MTAPHVIYTIGHGTDTFDGFLERITPQGVTMVVDVRSHPTSRHAPEFVKRNLEEASAEAGVGYRWLGSTLGGRPDDDTLADGSELPDWERIRASERFRGGLAELIGLWALEHVLALVRYGRLSSFHTALVRYGVLVFSGFLITLFLFGFVGWLFYVSAFLSLAAVLEQMAMIALLPEWTPDLRGGLPAALKRRAGGP